MQAAPRKKTLGVILLTMTPISYKEYIGGRRDCITVLCTLYIYDRSQSARPRPDNKYYYEKKFCPAPPWPAQPQGRRPLVSVFCHARACRAHSLSSADLGPVSGVARSLPQ